MLNELCMNCFNVKGKAHICPHCGYVEGTPPQEIFHLSPGTILANRYIVGTSIGFGGFGITYRAYDSVLGVIVAIKEFYPAGLVNRSPGEKQVGVMSGEKLREYQIQLQRFLIEAQSIAQFGKAKDIVNVYDYFEENCTAYIIMEYIDGILLKEYMEQEGRMEVETALYLIMPIIEALKKIHASGIIHRDVSPDNIFITSDGAIKIFDFGAARFAGEQEDENVEAVIKAGYAPPEQYRAKSRQGAFSDIYSVGAILYEMVTGVKPIEASDRLIKDTLQPPSQLGIRLDPNLDRAIMQAMAVRPEYRFQYVEHLQEAIEDKRVAEYPEEITKRLRRKRRLALSITLASLAACIVVAVVLANRIRMGNEILTTPVTECELTIWVPYEGSQTKEEAQKQMELLVKDFKSNSEAFEGNDMVSVSCEAVSADTYADKFEQAETKPDIYCTDYVDEADGMALDKLYDMLSEEDYYGLSEYEESHPELKSVPFGLRTLCVYFMNSEGSEAKIDLQEVLTEEQKKKIYLDQSMIGNLLVLEDSALLKSSPIAITEPAKENLKTINAYANILSIKKINNQVLESLSDKSKELKINAVIADTDFNKVLYNDNSENYSNPITYNRQLLTYQNSSLFVFCDTYAVNSRLSEDENKTRAALRFLYLCLSKTENSVYYSGTNRVIPIQRDAWKSDDTSEASYTNPLLEELAKGTVTPVFAAQSDLDTYGQEIVKAMQ